MKGAVRSINTITYAAVFAVFICLTDQVAVSFETDREILCAVISDSRTGVFEGKRRIIQTIQSQRVLFVIVNSSLFDISVLVIIFSKDIILVGCADRYSVDIEFEFGFPEISCLCSAAFAAGTLFRVI